VFFVPLFSLRQIKCGFSAIISTRVPRRKGGGGVFIGT
jgi:hypothetical protein